VVIAAVAVLIAIGAVLFARSRRRSRWLAAAEALARDTRTAVEVRVPQVLADVEAPARALSWPPVDAELVTLAGRWNEVAGTAPKDRRSSSRETGRLLGDLVAAVRAENDALLQGRDWTLLRGRIDQDRAAIAALVGPVQPTDLPPAQGQPGAPPP
jgi:type II secretory pathway pseudopilin PulG